MAEQKEYLRFTVPQRVEHWVLTISFTALAITGIPQKFVGNGWAETMIAMFGGIETTRLIHHTAALIMCVLGLYHVVDLAYKVFVLRIRWTMFPRLDDAIDGINAIRYNLGLTKDEPKMDRYNFTEKAEYWALIWGTVIMALTGFMMWNPILTTDWLPGEIIPAAKAAHGGEALLAVLAIIVWHFYGVHIKDFSKAMFTGKLTEHEMVEEHALELERIKKGKLDPRPAPEVIKQRQQVYIPAAAFASVVMLAGLYFVTSYQPIAITTLPRQPQIVVYAPITSTPTPKASSGTPQGIPVSAKPLPADHAGRTTCLACHANLTQPALPADHAGRTDATCTSCHKSGAAPAATPAASSTEVSNPPPAATSSGPKPLPADHAGRTTCLACHQNLPDPKLPADHQGRTDQTCLGCHKAASDSVPATVAPTASSSSSSASGPSPIPADHAGRTACLSCHQTLPQPALPADHQGRTDAMCVLCHKSQ